MSALIALFNTENDALVESVFVDSCIDLIDCLDETDLEKLNEYVTLLGEKKTKESLEQEISEALVLVMEHTAGLYGTFLYESTEDDIDPESAKTMLENIRTAFGREFVMEALSDKAKSRLKTAGKVGLGAAAVGAAGVGIYNHMKGNETESAVADNDAGSRTAAKIAGANDAGLKDGRNLAKFEKDAKTKKMFATLKGAHKGDARKLTDTGDKNPVGNRTARGQVPMKAGGTRSSAAQAVRNALRSRGKDHIDG